MPRSSRNISQKRNKRLVVHALDRFMDNFEFEESRVKLYSQLKIHNIHKETSKEKISVAVATEK